MQQMWRRAKTKLRRWVCKRICGTLPKPVLVRTPSAVLSDTLILLLRAGNHQFGDRAFKMNINTPVPGDYIKWWWNQDELWVWLEPDNEDPTYLPIKAAL